jgi:putative amide transporter protein
MAAVGLLFVGAVLFLNGLLLLGVVDGKSVAPFNLFVGALQTAVPFYLVATADSADDILLASGIFLFGFTYLYVGIANLAGHNPVGLGWYCAWVVILAVAFGLTNFFKFDDTKFGVIWLNWALLWGLFWAVLGLGRAQLTKFTGWVTLIMSFTTATVPAYLILLGEWDPIDGYWAIVVAGLEVLLFGLLWARSVPATTPGTPSAPSDTTTAHPAT